MECIKQSKGPHITKGNFSQSLYENVKGGFTLGSDTNDFKTKRNYWPRTKLWTQGVYTRFTWKQSSSLGPSLSLKSKVHLTFSIPCPNAKL